MPPKKKEQAKTGPKVAVDKTFGLKNVFRLHFALCGPLIIEKQIEKSTAVCAAGSATTGSHRHQRKGKGSLSSYNCRKKQKTGKRHWKIRKKLRRLVRMN